MTLVESGDAGGRAQGSGARRHGSPVAVTRSGHGSLEPPIPQLTYGHT